MVRVSEAERRADPASGDPVAPGPRAAGGYRREAARAGVANGPRTTGSYRIRDRGLRRRIRPPDIPEAYRRASGGAGGAGAAVARAGRRGAGSGPRNRGARRPPGRRAPRRGRSTPRRQGRPPAAKAARPAQRGRTTRPAESEERERRPFPDRGVRVSRHSWINGLESRL